MNRNLKNVVKEGIFLSRMKNYFKSKYDEGENFEIKTTENILTESKNNLNKSKITSSYQSLINSYSKSKKRYMNIYENRRTGIPSLNLKQTYLKNQENYHKYLNNKKNKKGLKLEGNKEYEDLSVDKYMDEINTYRENIIKLINENNWIYIYPEYNKTNLNKMKLTPLSYKSRLLMNTNKEKEDFNFAERNAVIMRRIEYTHSLITKNGEKKEKEKLMKEKQKIY